MTQNRKTPQHRSAIVILGMHRSGTSALAGVLNLLGCDLPRTLMPANAYNQKGYFESNAIRLLNDRHLKSAGSDWAGWLPVNPGWYESPKFADAKAECLDILDTEFGASPLFVLKDPRICRLMPLWTSVLADAEITPIYVHTHRNPMEVAASLQTRDNITKDLSMLIWLRHVLEAEYSTRGADRAFVNYAQLMENWAGTIKRIEQGLKLKFPRDLRSASEEADAFLSRDMQHHSISQDSVLENPLIAEWVLQTFRIMEKWSTKKEVKADHAELDRIRASFDDVAPIFAGLVDQGQASGKALKRAQDDVAALKTQTADLTQALEDETLRVADAQAALKEQESRLASALKDATQRAEQADTELAKLKNRQAKDLDAAQTERDAATKRAQVAQKELAALKDQQAKGIDAVEAERDAAIQRADAAQKELTALKDQQAKGLSAARAERDTATQRADAAQKELAALKDQQAKGLDAARAERDTATQRADAAQKELAALKDQQAKGLDAARAERDTARQRADAAQKELAALKDQQAKGLDAAQTERDAAVKRANAAHKELAALRNQQANDLNAVQAERDAAAQRADATQKELATLKEVQAQQLTKAQAEIQALKDSLSQSQSELVQRQHEAEQVGAANKALQQENATLTEKITSVTAETKTQTDALEQELGDAAQQLRELTELHDLQTVQYQQASADLTDLQVATEQRNRELAHLTRLRLEADADIEELKAEMQAEKAKNLDTLTDRAEKIAGLEAALTETSREMAEMSRILAEREAQLTQMGESAQKREDELLQQITRERKSAKQDQSMRDTALAQKHELQIQKVQFRTEQLQVENARLEKKVTKARAQQSRDRKQAQDREATWLIQLEAEQTRSAQEAAAAEAREQALNAKLEHERQRATRAEDRAQQILSSTSWRLMAPARSLASIFKRSSSR